MGMPSMNGPLVMAILFISMGSLCAQAQQPNTAKLKADAQKVVSSILSDKAKTRRIANLTVSVGRWLRLLRRKTARKLKRYLKG
jgi:hypothetical protein